MTEYSRQSRPIETPRPSVADIQRLAAAQLSLPSRLGHVLLLLLSSTVAVAIGSLWATEPGLPIRTHIAFALIVSIAIAWAAFSLWVLARRRVLFGADRVLAAAMGATFSAFGAAGLGAVAYWGEVGRGAYLGALIQIVIGAVAVVLFVRARRRVAALSRRRQEVEEQLARRS